MSDVLQLVNRCQQLTVRTERLEGREHLVAPVVMLVEGVHAGSGGAVFYPAEEVAHFAQAWNGVPVTVEHPTEHGSPISANHPHVVERQTIGRVFNTAWDGKRLKGEIWVDILKAQGVQGGAEALRYLRSGGQLQLEVSTGLFSDTDATAGTWNGEEYQTIARNIRPDHLALLPGGTGACSWRDGCGVRANKSGGTMLTLNELATQTAGEITENADRPEGLREVAGRFARLLGFAVLEIGQRQCHQELQRMLDSWDRREGPGSPVIHYLREVYDDSFVFERQSPQGTKLYRMPYTRTDNGAEVDEAMEPEEVRMRVEYAPMMTRNAHTPPAGGSTPPAGKGEDPMANQEGKVSICSLIENKATQFTEADRAWLSTLTAEQLERLVPVANAEPVKPAAPAAAPETPTLNAEDRDALEYGKRAMRERRTALAAGVMANAKDVYTQAELDAMDLQALEKLAKATKAPEPSFEGRPAPTANVGDAGPKAPEPYKPPAVNYGDKK